MFKEDDEFKQMLTAMDALVDLNSEIYGPPETEPAETETGDVSHADVFEDADEVITVPKSPSAGAHVNKPSRSRLRPKSAQLYRQPKVAPTGRRTRPASARMSASPPTSGAPMRASESFDEMFLRLSAKDKVDRGSARRLNMRPLDSNSVYNWCSTVPLSMAGRLSPSDEEADGYSGGDGDGDTMSRLHTSAELQATVEIDAVVQKETQARMQISFNSARRRACAETLGAAEHPREDTEEGSTEEEGERESLRDEDEDNEEEGNAVLDDGGYEESDVAEPEEETVKQRGTIDRDRVKEEESSAQIITPAVDEAEVGEVESSSHDGVAPGVTSDHDGSDQIDDQDPLLEGHLGLSEEVVDVVVENPATSEVLEPVATHEDPLNNEINAKVTSILPTSATTDVEQRSDTCAAEVGDYTYSNFVLIADDSAKPSSTLPGQSDAVGNTSTVTETIVDDDDQAAHSREPIVTLEPTVPSHGHPQPDLGLELAMDFNEGSDDFGSDDDVEFNMDGPSNAVAECEIATGRDAQNSQQNQSQHASSTAPDNIDGGMAMGSDDPPPYIDIANQHTDYEVVDTVAPPVDAVFGEAYQTEEQPSGYAETATIVFQCTQDFDPHEEVDLGMRVGELITIVSQVDENWLVGRIGDREGIFPASFAMPYSTDLRSATAYGYDANVGDNDLDGMDFGTGDDASSDGYRGAYSSVDVAVSDGYGERDAVDMPADVYASRDDLANLDATEEMADSGGSVDDGRADDLDGVDTAPHLDNEEADIGVFDASFLDDLDLQPETTVNKADFDDSFGDGMDLTASNLSGVSVDMKEMLAGLRAEVEEAVQRQATDDVGER